MKKYFNVVIILMVSSFILMACSNESSSNEGTTNQTNLNEEENNRENTSNNEEAEEEADSTNQEISEVSEEDENLPPWERDLPNVPTTYAEAVDYTITGEFAGQSYEEQQEEIEQELDKLPKLTDGFDEKADQYKKYIYSLFNEGYGMPNIPVGQWDAMTVGDPSDAEEGEQAELKEKYHVAILLDSSGSMANYENDKTRMELAKESINQFVSNLPEQAQVTLQVYGHKGSGSKEDKEMSCSSVETLYSLDTYQEEKFQSALDEFGPAGWTPIAKAIEDIKDDFEEFDGEKSTNIVYVVSDGEETCGGDPVQAVKDLANSDIQPVVNLIGYQANSEGIKQLKEMAKASDGNFINATNQDQLNEEFERTEDLSQIWSDWHGEKQGEIKDLHKTLSNQIHNWHDKLKERSKRQKANLDAALEYLESERNFEFGPDSGSEFRQSNLAISDEVRSLFLELDNTNRLEFLSISNDVRMEYLEGMD